MGRSPLLVPANARGIVYLDYWKRRDGRKQLGSIEVTDATTGRVLRATPQLLDADFVQGNLEGEDYGLAIYRVVPETPFVPGHRYTFPDRFIVEVDPEAVTPRDLGAIRFEALEPARIKEVWLAAGVSCTAPEPAIARDYRWALPPKLERFRDALWYLPRIVAADAKGPKPSKYHPWGFAPSLCGGLFIKNHEMPVGTTRLITQPTPRSINLLRWPTGDVLPFGHRYCVRGDVHAPMLLDAPFAGRLLGFREPCPLAGAALNEGPSRGYGDYGPMKPIRFYGAAIPSAPPPPWGWVAAVAALLGFVFSLRGYAGHGPATVPREEGEDESPAVVEAVREAEEPHDPLV